VDYYDIARQGAFAEIPREMIQEYMPVWYADNADNLVSATVDGKIYAIPDSEPKAGYALLVLRRDWFPEGMTEVRSLADFYRYLENVKETQPEVMPFGLSEGEVGWLIGAFSFPYTGMMSAGAGNATSAVALSKFDNPNFRVFPNWSHPDILTYYEMMKQMYDAGFWTADNMNFPTSQWETFPAGLSGTGWAGDLDGVEYYRTALRQNFPDADIAVYDLGSEKQVPVDTGSPMGFALAVPTNGTNMERTLMLVELIYNDPYLHRLFKYGIEGEDYELNDKGEIIQFDVDNLFGFWPPYWRASFDFIPDGGFWEGRAAIEAEWATRTNVNPFVGFGLDTTAVSDIASNLWNIHMQYAMPIYLGMVDNVQDAIDELNRLYDEAGYQEYEDELFRQLEQFIRDNGLDVLGYSIFR
jgi:hypothetical protein